MSNAHTGKLPTPDTKDALPCPHCGDIPKFHEFTRSEYHNGWTGKLSCCAEMEHHVSYNEGKDLQLEQISARLASDLLSWWNKRSPTHVYKIEIDATSGVVESTNSHAKSST